MCCSVLQCVAVCCSVLQCLWCAATRCRHVHIHEQDWKVFLPVKYVAVQCVASSCSLLQCVADICERPRARSRCPVACLRQDPDGPFHVWERILLWMSPIQKTSPIQRMSPKNEPLKTCTVGNEPYPSLIGKTNQISYESNIRKSFSDGYLDKTSTKCIRIFARQHPGRLDHIGRFFRGFQIIRAFESHLRIFFF